MRNNVICWKPRAVSSTSAMIPKINMKVVTPNMNILGGDEVKPGLPLKSVILSAYMTFLRKHDEPHRRMWTEAT